VPSVKYGNYLLSVLATRAARAKQAHEALIVSRAGHVAEGASSNVFYVKHGVLHTPPLSSGILPGITRQHLLQLAEQLGVPVEYSLPRVDDLVSADEVAISSSIREFVPVVRIDETPIASGVPGPITRRLLQAFRALAWYQQA
jgi:branched-chain amino acid aminotransferase